MPTSHGTEHRWQSSGPCVGWYADDGIYLDAEASYAVAQQAAAATGGGIGVLTDTLNRRLYDAKMLVAVDRRGGKLRFKVRQNIGGGRHPVLHVAHRFLSIVPPSSANGGPSGPSGLDEVFDQENQDASD